MLATSLRRVSTSILSRRIPTTTSLAAASNNNIIQQTQRRNYHENIVEHYENPRNVGSFDKNDDDVGTVSLVFIWYCDVCINFMHIFLRTHKNSDGYLVLHA